VRQLRGGLSRGGRFFAARGMVNPLRSRCEYGLITRRSQDRILPATSEALLTQVFPLGRASFDAAVVLPVLLRCYEARPLSNGDIPGDIAAMFVQKVDRRRAQLAADRRRRVGETGHVERRSISRRLPSRSSLARSADQIARSHRGWLVVSGPAQDVPRAVAILAQTCHKTHVARLKRPPSKSEAGGSQLWQRR
jgi:hypothetical protein